MAKAKGEQKGESVEWIIVILSSKVAIRQRKGRNKHRKIRAKYSK
jgi:hypothetical protein